MAICEERDVKGLYQLARQNKIKAFTGISAPFVSPLHANLVLDSSPEYPYQSITRLYNRVISLIKADEF
ncbi:adenylyl-sulfate kinase [Mucilaginibacter ginsenosidivorax]|uniref:Adenylyl-sulfate kinase n=1 Tax=Mucilaginibacter ginsenosidivorax TaxID=862126 RepID=A0A5B8WCB3_9SPHI|nr:adenylyl-sulfate kinase [Mucilaginibacter ginsenosidivorax]